jgi:chitinase
MSGCLFSSSVRGAVFALLGFTTLCRAQDPVQNPAPAQEPIQAQSPAHDVVRAPDVMQTRAQPHPRPRASWHLHKRPLVVGYFLQAGVHSPQPYYVKTLLTNGSARKLDQLNYSRGSVHAGRCSVADPPVDLDFTFTAAQSVNGRPDDPASIFRGNFHQLEELKQRYPKLKILISLEDKAADFAEGARPENRRAFVASCVDTFIRGHFAAGVTRPGIFDGIDVDWESPQIEDAANFLALLQEFRSQLDAVRPGLRLSVAVSDSPLTLPGTDFAAVARTVDQVGMMNYDYAGPWNTHTGFVAPLFGNPDAPRDYNSIEHSIASYEALGVPAKKLLMGVPFYGYSWTRVEEANHGLFQEGDGVRDDQPYHKIRALTEPFLVYRDPRSQAPWRFDGDTFWTYEDPVSVRYKVSYAARHHLAGVMIWELSGDTEDAELLQTAYHALHHPLRKRVFAEATLTAAM